MDPTNVDLFSYALINLNARKPEEEKYTQSFETERRASDFITEPMYQNIIRDVCFG